MLLTNGCSFVWGDELEGFDNDPPTHYQYRFSEILAKKLNMPLANIATCGACNMKIFRDTIDYLMTNPKPEYVVILWSAWQRGEVAENLSKEEEEALKIQRWQCMSQISPNRIQCVRPEKQKSLSLYYRDVQQSRADVLQGLSLMKAMQLTCDSMGIKLLQGVFHNKMWKNILATFDSKSRDENWGDLIDYLKASLSLLRPECRIGLGYYTDMYTLGELKHSIKPYGHPDEATNAEYADILYNIILETWNPLER